MPDILIVEDEILIAMEMEAVVMDLGYRCAGIADDMTSAMAIAQDKIDIALVDVNLSDGATGPEIGARLANECSAEVVFITANPSQLGNGISGTVGALEKPLDLALLGELLEYLLAVRQGQPAEPPSRLVIFEPN